MSVGWKFSRDDDADHYGAIAIATHVRKISENMGDISLCRKSRVCRKIERRQVGGFGNMGTSSRQDESFLQI